MLSRLARWDRAAARSTFFDGHPAGRAVAASVRRAVEGLGPHEVRISRSQVAFRRRTGFAYLWRPGQYLSRGAPAVLSLALPREVPSERWKEVVHPAAHVWMHHLELSTPEEVDAEVRAGCARRTQRRLTRASVARGLQQGDALDVVG